MRAEGCHDDACPVHRCLVGGGMILVAASGGNAELEDRPGF